MISKLKHFALLMVASSIFTISCNQPKQQKDNVTATVTDELDRRLPPIREK